MRVNCPEHSSREVAAMAVGTIDRVRTREADEPERLGTSDTDVHHGIRDKSDLYPYLSKLYAERFAEYGGGGAGNLYAHNGGVQGYRADVVEAQRGSFPGAAATNVEFTRHHLLDECVIDRAVLTGSSMYSAAAMPDLDYASALCRAF